MVETRSFRERKQTLRDQLEVLLLQWDRGNHDSKQCDRYLRVGFQWMQKPQEDLVSRGKQAGENEENVFL